MHVLFQYTMQDGDTLESVAQVLSTTPEAIVNLNRNRITHFENPARLAAGDVICVLPNYIDVRFHICATYCNIELHTATQHTATHNPARLAAGDVTCVLPNYIDVRFHICAIHCNAELHTLQHNTLQHTISGMCVCVYACGCVFMYMYEHTQKHAHRLDIYTYANICKYT